MIELLFVIGIIYVLAKISSPSVWSGWTPPRHRKQHYRRGEKPYGLPWMGGTMKPRKDKKFWED